MSRAGLAYFPAELTEKNSSNFMSLQQRQSTTILRRTSSNPRSGLTPSYRLGTALGTVGGVALLLVCIIYFWNTRRTRFKGTPETESPVSSIAGPWEPIQPIQDHPFLGEDRPLERPHAGQGRPLELPQHGQGRPLEQAQQGGGRPLEQAQRGRGRPLEQVQQGGGRPLEQVQQDGGRPLEQAQPGQGRPLERPHQGEGRPLERPPRGGRARRGGGRPLERPPSDDGIPPIRGGDAFVERRGWTRPSRKKTAARRNGLRYPASPTKVGLSGEGERREQRRVQRR